MSLNALNGMEFIGAHIKFKVLGFKEKIDGATYYQIQLTFTMKEPFKIRDLSYTYQHCLSVCQALCAQCPDLPILPSPSIFEFRAAAVEVEKRRIDLEKWLMAIVWRCDVVGTEVFQEFCNIRDLIEANWLDAPQPSLELKKGHAFGVVDFLYDPNTQVCFVATADDSLMSKVQGFVSVFTKGIITSGGGPMKSQIICYRLDVDAEGEPQTNQLWLNTYVNKITLMTWDEKLTILAVGFETGQILVLRITPEKGYLDCSEICYFIKHTDAVRGLATNCLDGQLYSISKDRCLITTDLTNHNKILKEKEFPHELICMLQQRDCRRLFVGDGVGSIYIFHYQDGSLLAAHHITPTIKLCITSLHFHAKKNFLVCGSREGTILVYEIGLVGKERMSSVVSKVVSVPNQKSVVFSLSSREFHINYGSNVLIVDSAKNKVLYSLQAHKEPVTKMEMFEDLGLLITSGRDGSVKFWQYKYFTHTQINKYLAPYRGEYQQKEEEAEMVKQVKRQGKPLLEELDDWAKE